MKHNTGTSAPHGRRVVQTAADVRQLLGAEIAYVSAHPDLEPLERARAVTQLARAALRAIEVETFAARLEAVEAALKVRKEINTEDHHAE